MGTQWCLPPPLTSTVKSSLFTHAHSSSLSLAARLHQCYTHHFYYINNGWTFSGQTSYISHWEYASCLLLCWWGYFWKVPKDGDWLAKDKGSQVIRGLDLFSLASWPPGRGQGLEVESIHNGQLFNKSCLCRASTKTQNVREFRELAGWFTCRAWGDWCILNLVTRILFLDGWCQNCADRELFVAVGETP